jgi:hypothetical protein
MRRLQVRGWQGGVCRALAPIPPNGSGKKEHQMPGPSDRCQVLPYVRPARSFRHPKSLFGPYQEPLVISPGSRHAMAQLVTDLPDVPGFDGRDELGAAALCRVLPGGGRSAAPCVPRGYSPGSLVRFFHFDRRIVLSHGDPLQTAPRCVGTGARCTNQLSCFGRSDLRAEYRNSNSRRCVRPEHATNVVLSALVYPTGAGNANSGIAFAEPDLKPLTPRASTAGVLAYRCRSAPDRPGNPVFSGLPSAGAIAR